LIVEARPENSGKTAEQFAEEVAGSGEIQAQLKKTQQARTLRAGDWRRKRIRKEELEKQHKSA